MATLPTTDRQTIEAWLAGRALSTQAAYEADARKFLAFAGKPLSEITDADLDAWIAQRAAAGITGGSLSRHISAMRGLLSFVRRINALSAPVPTRPQRPLRASA